MLEASWGGYGEGVGGLFLSFELYESQSEHTPACTKSNVKRSQSIPSLQIFGEEIYFLLQERGRGGWLKTGQMDSVPQAGEQGPVPVEMLRQPCEPSCAGLVPGTAHEDSPDSGRR